ncbi:unnamed protein product [Adineta steineri]|uniref:MAM domain-containing protein n=1 Tax=Adineta steineri TaxID=433720 RepID=A0A818L3J0_9BILA|nr:unnamed protein product [Adineta steineri]CAF3565247.1 unnamed protein product [Adineta steineri]
MGSADEQSPTAPLSDVTSSLKPTSNGQSCNLPYKINSFTWDMYFCNEGYCQTSTDSTSKCSSGKFGYFGFAAVSKVSFTLNTASGGADGTDEQCLIYYYYLPKITGTDLTITVRKQEAEDISETIDTVTSSPYNGWIKRQVSFHTSKGGYKIYFDFEKTFGPPSSSTIIAIDEISVLQGDCLSEPTTQSTPTILVGTTTSITESDSTTIGITSILTEPITTTTITTTTTSTTTTTTTSSTTTTTSTSTITSTATTTAITTITTSTTTTTTTSTSIQTTTSTISTSSTAKTTAVTISTTTTSLSTHLIITTTVMTNQPSSIAMITNFTSNSTVSTTPSSKVYIIILATVIPIGTVAIVILILWIKKPMPFKKSKVNVLEMNEVVPDSI